MRTLLAAMAAVVVSACAVQAQTVVGGTGGATMIMRDGNVINVGSILGEIEYQFPWGEEVDPKHYGGLVAYVGINSEGGGAQTGLGYRHYIRAGSVYPGFGVGGFALGDETPEITELSIFVGPELVLEVPIGETEDDADKVTGFLGVYGAVAGDTDVAVVRAGIRAALN